MMLLSSLEVGFFVRSPKMLTDDPKGKDKDIVYSLMSDPELLTPN